MITWGKFFTKHRTIDRLSGRRYSRRWEKGGLNFLFAAFEMHSALAKLQSRYELDAGTTQPN